MPRLGTAIPARSSSDRSEVEIPLAHLVWIWLTAAIAVAGLAATAVVAARRDGRAALLLIPFGGILLFQAPFLVFPPEAAGGFDVEDIDPALFARIAPQMPLVAEPEDIAALVAYLACDESRYMTGSILTIDGGQLA